MDALLQQSIVITNNRTGFVLRGWAWDYDNEVIIAF